MWNKAKPIKRKISCNPIIRRQYSAVYFYTFSSDFVNFCRYFGVFSHFATLYNRSVFTMFGGRMEREQIYNIIRQCNMHRQKVLGVCMRYFGFSIDDAEDCVQEAYFALYNDLLQGKKIQNPTAWLHKVAINQGKKLVCAQQQKREYTFTSTEEMERVIGNIPCNPDLLDLMVTDDEIEQNAVAILSALTDKERTLYILHYKRHIKLKDIAKRQKLPEATVRKQHQRLKKKLLKMINNL